jgi:hypothetical protein
LQSLDRYALARAVKARDLDEMVEQWLVVNKKSRYLGQVKKEK